jgi:hypothetical protein
MKRILTEPRHFSRSTRKGKNLSWSESQAASGIAPSEETYTATWRNFERLEIRFEPGLLKNICKAKLSMYASQS